MAHNFLAARYKATGDRIRSTRRQKMSPTAPKISGAIFPHRLKALTLLLVGEAFFTNEQNRRDNPKNLSSISDIIISYIIIKSIYYILPSARTNPLTCPMVVNRPREILKLELAQSFPNAFTDTD
jgi:hypothetical protein